MRKASHTQGKEPILEYLLRELRFQQALKHVKKGSYVADIGCGYNGAFLKRISKNIKKGVGFDVSVTKRGLPKNITLKAISISEINKYGKNYFDVVFALAVIEHVDNPESFLKLAHSMLKKGGKLVITTPHRKSKKLLEMLSVRFGLISKNEIEDHKNYFDEDGLKKALKLAGFKKISVKPFEVGLNIVAVAYKD